MHEHSFRCTVESCGRGTYVDVVKQLRMFPTRAELIAKKIATNKKRQEAIALMRRQPREDGGGSR